MEKIKFDESYHHTRLKYPKGKEVVWKEVSKYLKKYIGGTILDVGCGDGIFLRYASAKKKIGLDVFKDPRFPKTAIFIKAPVWQAHKHVKDVDVIFASNLLEHLSDKELDESIDSLKKCLKSGGLLILLQPNFKYAYKHYFDDYTHKKIFTHISLIDFLKANKFKIVKVYPKFLPATIKSKLPKWRIFIWGYLNSPIKPFAGQMLIIAKK